MDHRWLTDIRIDEVSVSYKHYIYRSPIKFGGVVLDKFTLLNVQCGCVTRDGKTAQGFGSMPLSNQWAFPTAKMPYDATLDAMTALAERARRICEEHGEFGHPLELGVTLEEKFLAAASEISVQRNLAELKDSLNGQGIQIDKIEVSVDAGGRSAVDREGENLLRERTGREDAARRDRNQNPDFEESPSEEYGYRNRTQDGRVDFVA